MATVVVLLPTVRVADTELVEICWRLQTLGINATTGHSGPYGSISIDNQKADAEVARKVVAAYEAERAACSLQAQP